jgi:hypothetical protein
VRAQPGVHEPLLPPVRELADLERGDRLDFVQLLRAAALRFALDQPRAATEDQRGRCEYQQPELQGEFLGLGRYGVRNACTTIEPEKRVAVEW